MRVRALSCLAAFSQQTLTCCEKHDSSSINTPRTFTSVTDMGSRYKTYPFVGVGENSMHWTISQLAYISFISSSIPPPVLVQTMMSSSNGNRFRVAGTLWGEFTGHRWIPRTEASDAELWCFLFNRTKHSTYVIASHLNLRVSYLPLCRMYITGAFGIDITMMFKNAKRFTYVYKKTYGKL